MKRRPRWAWPARRTPAPFSPCSSVASRPARWWRGSMAPRRRDWPRRRWASGGVAASLFGIVLRGAKALEPLRERTRRVTLPDVREERRVRAIERYRAFIDSASDGIVVVDGAGRGPLHEPRRRGGDRLRARRPGGQADCADRPRAVSRRARAPHRAGDRRRAGRQLRSRSGDHLGRSHHRVGRVDCHPLRARGGDLLVPRRDAGARARTRAAPDQRVPEAHLELGRRRRDRREHAGDDRPFQPRRRADLRL